MGENKTSWLDCEHRRDEYCTNHIRHESCKGIVLLFCLMGECEYPAFKKWW